MHADDHPKVIVRAAAATADDTPTAIDAGNALFANATFDVGDSMASFPPDAYFSAHSLVKTYPPLRRLLSSQLDNPNARWEKWILSLALVLAISSSHNDSSHPWEVYARSLPGPHPQSGVWDHDHLAQRSLQATSIGAAIEAKQRVVGSVEVWAWAESIVSSRSIGVGDAREADVSLTEADEVVGGLIERGLPEVCDLLLVPLLDMCNHADDHTVVWDIDSHDNVILHAKRPLEEGDELTLSYGNDKTNAELFFNYGFVLDANSRKPSHTYTLQLPDPQHDGNAIQGFWRNVTHTIGLSPRVTFKVRSQQSDAAEQQEADYWADIIPDDEHVAAVYLATEPTLLQDDAIFTLFGESGCDGGPERRLQVANFLIHELTSRSHCSPPVYQGYLER
ncbi:hypothetical protein PYCC9005_005021 [Savitreella phatthalungensis]